MRIDGFIWLGAFLISLTLHGLMLYRAENVVGLEEREQAARSQSTRVSFRAQSAPPPVADPPAKPPEEPPPKPRRVEESPPKPVEKPEPKPESKPAPPEEVVEQVTQPEPVEAVDEEPSPEAQAAAAPPSSVSEAESEALRAAARRHYLARLMAHIEAHKHYPRSARRRGIEGKVTVRFELEQGGRVAGLVVEGGHRLLRAAAEDAVESALPLPGPPDEVSLPLSVEFAIRFQLH